MKIALPVYLHGFGGAERQVIALANQMVDRGHEVHLFLLSDDKIEYTISNKVIIHSLLSAENGVWLKKIHNRRKALIKALRKLHCDVVVNFNFQSAYLLSAFRSNEDAKIIYCERGDPGDKEYSGLMGLIRKFVLHKIDGYVFQSEGARDYFKDNYVKNHSAIVPNACFLDKQEKSKNRSKRIVNVGRLSAQKNQRILIEAFSRLITVFPDYVLEIYGDGELKESLSLYVSDCGLSQKVKFMGTTPNIIQAIKDASLFVLSSDFEGVPNALIEAMAVGIPCISTDCKPGGARTLISNNYDGIITPLKDSEALAQAMLFILSNPHKAEEMATNALKIVDRLSPQLIYDKWENFIMQITNQSHRH